MTSQAFGQHIIKSSNIFFRSAFSIAFVNLKPILPGHVLVIPKRVVPRFTELTEEEVSDLFASVQKTGRILEKVYNATSLTIAIQDGPDAGQSINHVHVHVIPRRVGDFVNNDEIYSHINTWNKLDNNERRARSFEEMSTEAEQLRSFFS